MEDKEKIRKIEHILDDLDSGIIRQEGKKQASYITIEKIKDIIYS